MTFMEEKENGKPFRVFCDMDGVLVNFIGGLQKAFEKNKHLKPVLQDAQIDWSKDDLEGDIEKHLINKGVAPKVAKHKAIAYFWGIPHGFMKGGKKTSPEVKAEKDKKVLDFWSNLQWLPDGKALWDYLTQLKKQGIISELKILSSPSDDPMSEKGKRKWLKNNIGLDDSDIIIKKEKWEEVETPFDILIDDIPKKLVGNEKRKGWATVGGTPILHKSTKSTKAALKAILKMSEDQLKNKSKKVVNQLRNIQDVYVILDDQIALATYPAKFENNFSNDKETFDHHVTVYFKPSLEEWDYINTKVKDGDAVEVVITGIHSSEDIGAEAFSVDLYKDGSKIDVPNRILHVTHSLREGAEAKDSNVMLRQSSKQSEEVPNLRISGRVSFVEER